jgi:hypothetical protein
LPFRLADPIGACLWGFALALLFLLKVTYGLAAIGIFLVAQIVQPGRWREGALVALSFGLALLVADVIAGGQVRAYLADLEMTARMPSNGLRLTKLMLEVPAFIVFAFGTFILLFAVTHGDAERVGRPSLQSWRALIVALATGGSGLIVLMQNHYKTEAATLLLMPLIVGEWTGLLALLPTTPEPIWRRRHGDWIALLLVATLALPAIDAGFILAQRVQLIRKAPLVEFARTEFHDLIIEKTRLPDANAACANGTCRDYLRMIRGRSLLRQYCAAKSNPVVLAANFSNPFPALMGWPSPSASPIWLHDGRSFSSVTHIPPHKLLGDVDCLMEAKREPNSLAFMEIYGSHVSQGYLSTGENEDWRIWIRGSSTK